MEFIRRLLKSRTIIFNTVIVVIGLAVMAFGIVENDMYDIGAGILIMIIGGIGFFLRVITNKPLSEKGLARSKTIIFNAVLGLIGALEAYSGFLQSMFEEEQFFGMFMVAVGTIGFILRTATTTPVGYA